MTSNLEYKGQPAQFNAKLNCVMVDGVPIEDGAQVTVCSWCKGADKLTKDLAFAGFDVTPGVCKTDSDKFMSNLKTCGFLP